MYLIVKRRIAILLPIFIAIVLLGLGLARLALAQSGLHGDYLDVTDACAACHRVHTGLGAGRLHSAAQNEFCYTCHNGTGAPAVPVISTHSNADFSGGVEAGFSLYCVQCHNPHGSLGNLYSIKEHVLVQDSAPPITTGPVVFTATVGMNSYDDGVNDRASRICVTCHDNSDNPGYPMTHHVGGANHLGGTDYAGQDCTTCHPHSADEDRDTLDGFMAAGGCTGCHSAPQDDGDGQPPGGRRAITSEFENISRHIQDQVLDNDCQVCHAEGPTHADGLLQLADTDTPTIYSETTPGDFRPETITVADSKALKSFCLSCHDADGAGGDTTPFSDEQFVLDIEGGTAWSSSAHNTGESTNSGYGCLGDGVSTGCHATAHGSQKKTLLAPATSGGGTDNVNEEEGFCYTCHDADGLAPTDIQAEFAQSSHHQVNDAEQAASGSAVECINCHNPHRNTTDQPLSNPDSLYDLWSGSVRNFCLRCHDDSPPASVTFPAMFDGTGWDKSQYVGSDHDAVLGGSGCQGCHERHGSSYYSLLKNQYVKTDYNEYTYGDGDYALCFTCHVEDTIVRTSGGHKAVNAFDDLHDKHVRGEDSPCIHCHDAHYSYDAGEPGLINYVYGVEKMDISLAVDGDTYDYSSAFRIFDSETKGECYLDCHGKDHKLKDYDRSPIESPTGAFSLTGTPTSLPAGTLSPSPTGTLSPTATPTPTATPSSTDTPTATSSGTPTATDTASPTLTATLTPLSTGTLSATDTATAVASSTSTPTATPSGTPTATDTASPILTATGTPAATLSSTPTVTDTASPIPTATGTPATTPSSTSAVTDTASLTPTATGTPAATPSSAPAVTDTASPIPTATGTPTATPSGTPTATDTASPILTATGTPAATPSGIATPTPPPTDTPNPTVAPAVRRATTGPRHPGA